MRYLVILLLFIAVSSKAQQLDSLSRDTLHDVELRLQGLGVNMIQSMEEDQRLLNARTFLITLSRALRIENSYYYKFDSVNCASIKYSPDNRFRIITWNIVLNNERFHYFGVLQFNPEYVKKLKDTTGFKSIVPLIDRSEQLELALDTTLSPNTWYGANYYKIVPFQKGKQTMYLLLGWSGANAMINRKIVDVLWFDGNLPRFGTPVFDMKEPRFKRPLSRMVWEFNNHASMTLKYSEKKKYLIYEVVLPVKPQDYGHPETYLPDGSFEYMMLNKGIWEKQKGILRDFDIE